MKPEYRKEFHNALRQHAVFYKHAEKDPAAELDAINPEANDFLAMFAITRYRELGKPLSAHMTTFASWFGWVHPRCLTDVPNTAYGDVQELFRQFSREEQLAFGKIFLQLSVHPKWDIEPLNESFAKDFPSAFARANSAIRRILEKLPQQPLSTRPPRIYIPKTEESY